MKRLLVASKNAGKAEEIRTILKPLNDWQLDRLPASHPDCEETGSSYLENARQKALFYSQSTNEWTVADDSGIEVDVLGGWPGIYSARFAPDDKSRNEELLRRLEGVALEKRTAQFICSLALVRSSEVVWTAEERIYGRIVFEPTGNNGFGYDPIFWNIEFGKTMAELETQVKNQVSHRGKALERLQKYLAKI